MRTRRPRFDGDDELRWLRGEHLFSRAAPISGRSQEIQRTPWSPSRHVIATAVEYTDRAVGFTWEHEFHCYLRRTYTPDRLFGDWRSLEHEIGKNLQRTGAVPRIGTL